MTEHQRTEMILQQYADKCRSADRIDPELYGRYGVKRGLRDLDGTGVLTGLTNISRIDAFRNEEGQKVPCEGKLWYRGYDMQQLVSGFWGKRYGFEEIAYLLLFGTLPTEEELLRFRETLAASRTLPRNFTRDVILKAPTRDLMNSITRSVLTLASYDKTPNDLSIENVLRQCVHLIGVFPLFSVYAYDAYQYSRNHSLYIHRPKPELSTAENVLRLLRPDKSYTELEAQVLDMALVLHMEHGGGNNSTFTTRVITSSGSDTYSVMAAALCSLKGPKHGGANIKVVEMMNAIKAEVPNPADEKKLKRYLEKIVDKQVFDKKGLIYGMGHAVYSLSDPRAEVLKSAAEELAMEKGREKDLQLYKAVEKLAPEVIAEKRRIYKGVSTNVDFYSGMVYGMLGIPQELFTPLFAIARIIGWSAHRIEELVNADKIIRPSYKSVIEEKDYLSLEERSAEKGQREGNTFVS